MAFPDHFTDTISQLVTDSCIFPPFVHLGGAPQNLSLRKCLLCNDVCLQDCIVTVLFNRLADCKQDWESVCKCYVPFDLHNLFVIVVVETRTIATIPCIPCCNAVAGYGQNCFWGCYVSPRSSKCTECLQHTTKVYVVPGMASQCVFHNMYLADLV